LSSERIFDITYGGTEKFTICLGKWLFRKNNNVTLIGSGYFARVKVKRLFKSDLKTDRDLTDDLKGVKRVNLSYHIRLLCSLVLIPSWVLKILFTNRRHPIALIHVQDTGYAALAAIISSKILDIPVILTSHGLRDEILLSTVRGPFNKIFLRFEHYLEKVSIKHATNIIVVNELIKNRFEVMVDKKIDVLPIPINLTNFQFSQSARNSFRKGLGIDEKGIVIGYIGRFSPEKNIPTLLNAFTLISEKDPFVKLVLVGAGPQESELRRIISKNNLEDRVIFLGVRDDVSRVLSGMDIFVLPSYTEGLCTALLEAMACGRSIICSNIFANRAILEHNEQALLFDPHDEKKLECAMDLLMNDALFRALLGENSKNKVSEYDEEIVFSRILTYYNTVISKYVNRAH
jgi:glycosyltransferase involved in cell wall biosynthesis